jgi:predicted nucleic acid-binding protein
MQGSSLTVVYDACVLYPAPLRDLLMWLALSGLFRAKWTEQIHEEWISNVLEKRPDLNRKQLERTKQLMNQNVHDCLVTGYEQLIEGLELPDLNDRHVLATAIKSNAQVIVTFNLKDFPHQNLTKYEISAQHPDELILDLINLNSEIVCQAVNNQLNTLKNPPMTLEELLNILEKQQLLKSVELLRKLLLN